MGIKCLPPPHRYPYPVVGSSVLNILLSFDIMLIVVIFPFLLVILLDGDGFILDRIEIHTNSLLSGLSFQKDPSRALNMTTRQTLAEVWRYISS